MSECYDMRKTRLALKMEEGHDPRNAGGLQQMEMAKRQILPYNLQKGTNPVYTLILDQ